MKRRVLRLITPIGFLVLSMITLYPGMLRAAYPEKPITVIVGYRAGGTTDSITRALIRPLSDILNQTLVIINKPGAGNRIAINTLKNAKPDGYTVLSGPTGGFVFAPHVQKVPYTLDNFEYIAAIARFQQAYVSSPEKPWKTFNEMIAWAKKNKKPLTLASLGPSDKLIALDIAKKEGIRIKAVPVKGGAAVMPAVMGQHQDFGYSAGSYYSYARAGKMTVLASLQAERLAAFPDVPTLQELGYDLVSRSFMFWSAPKGTPKPIIEKLANAIRQAIKDPGFIDLVSKKMHYPVFFAGPEETEKMIRLQSDADRDMIQRAGLKGEKK
jgi:tripartite-type tricarboxylate transporter receptor subunit TctC